MTIIRRIDGHILFQADTPDMAECLRWATHQNVDLRDADLHGLDLRGKLLRGVNLSKTFLQRTDFHAADIAEANLRSADLSDTNFSFANLYSTDLQGARLLRANLYFAQAAKADFTNADMIHVTLQEADLRGAVGIDPHVIASLRILPEGHLIGWKKCRDGVIVKLQISAQAKRSNSTDRKCRAEYVNVLEIINGDIGISMYDEDVIYERGKTVTCDRWEEDPWITCGGGIHFFITREEAEAFEL